MPGRQSIPSTGPRPHGSGRGRGGRGRGKGRGRSGGRGRGINIHKSLQQQNTTDCNQHPKQQCASCHNNTDRIKELLTKTTAGLLCLDEMTSVLDKLRIYLEGIQNDAAGLIVESNYENSGAGGIQHIQQETASNNTLKTLQDAINARPQYLTVSPSTYISWLENELEITTLSDLHECIVECINDTENGNNNIDILARDDVNGHVWIKSGMRGAFRKYILRISAEEKGQLGKEVLDEQASIRSRSPRKCFLGSPPPQDVPRDLQQEIVQISNRLDVDSAEEIVRGELPKDDKSLTPGKKTKLKKQPDGGMELSTKEQRDDCINKGFKSSDEVRGLVKSGFGQPSGGIDNSGFCQQSQQPPLASGQQTSGFPTGFGTANTIPTANNITGFCNSSGGFNSGFESSPSVSGVFNSTNTQQSQPLQQQVNGVEKGSSEEHAKRSTSPRGSVSSICNLVGSMDNRLKKEKANAKTVGSNSKSPTSDLQQAAARVVSPKTKAVTVELNSPKGAAINLENVSTPPPTSPTSDSKARSTSVDNQKGSEGMTKPKGKIVGSLPPPTPPPPVTPLTPPKVDKKTVEDVEQDKSSAVVVSLPVIKKKQKKKPTNIHTNPSHPFGKTQFARTNLSQYIKKSNPNSKKSVNPIFDLLQNEGNRGRGRRLLELEGKAFQHHKTITNLLRMKEDAIKHIRRKVKRVRLIRIRLRGRRGNLRRKNGSYIRETLKV